MSCIALLRKAAVLGLVAYGAMTAITTGPARAEDPHWRDHVRREHAWHDAHPHWDHRYWDDRYGYVYQPPAVVYTPPPPPGIGFVFQIGR